MGFASYLEMCAGGVILAGDLYHRLNSGVSQRGLQFVIAHHDARRVDDGPARRRFAQQASSQAFSQLRDRGDFESASSVGQRMPQLVQKPCGAVSNGRAVDPGHHPFYARMLQKLRDRGQ
jgi:hypothetical protein